MDYETWVAEQRAEREAARQAGRKRERFARSLVSDDDHRYVYANRPRCPVCRSSDLQTTRSIDNGDGTRTQSKHCRTCDHSFELIWQ